MSDEYRYLIVPPMTPGELMRQHEFECEMRIGVDEHGSVKAWADHLFKQRQEDPDRKIARRIMGMLSSGKRSIPGVPLYPKKKMILEDNELGMFFCCVAKFDGWHEELERVRKVQLDASTKLHSIERLLILEDEAIYSLIPQYREWGRILIDQNADTGYEKAVADFLVANPDKSIKPL